MRAQDRKVQPGRQALKELEAKLATLKEVVPTREVVGAVEDGSEKCGTKLDQALREKVYPELDTKMDYYGIASLAVDTAVEVYGKEASELLERAGEVSKDYLGVTPWIASTWVGYDRSYDDGIKCDARVVQARTDLNYAFSLKDALAKLGLKAVADSDIYGRLARLDGEIIATTKLNLQTESGVRYASKDCGPGKFGERLASRGTIYKRSVGDGLLKEFGLSWERNGIAMASYLYARESKDGILTLQGSFADEGGLKIATELNRIAHMEGGDRILGELGIATERYIEKVGDAAKAEGIIKVFDATLAKLCAELERHGSGCNKGGGNGSEGCDPGRNPDKGHDDEQDD